MSVAGMGNLTIPGSPSSPSVRGNWEAGVLTLTGDSYPDDPFTLYQRITAWIERFLATENRRLALELHLLYLNTGSVAALMDIFRILEQAHLAGRAVVVNWHYDRRNERIAELAREFHEEFSFPFAVVGHD